jgi:hypothetical protein
VAAARLAAAGARVVVRWRGPAQGAGFGGSWAGC